MLVLSGDRLDFEETSALLGVQPDMVRRKGEPFGSRNTPSVETFWEKSLDVTGDNIEPPLLKVIETVWPRRRELAALRTKKGISVTMVLWIDALESWPVMILGANTVARLAALDASLDMDLADYRAPDLDA
jgi:hypothetical protein